MAQRQASLFGESFALKQPRRSFFETTVLHAPRPSKAPITSACFWYSPAEAPPRPLPESSRGVGMRASPGGSSSSLGRAWRALRGQGSLPGRAPSLRSRGSASPQDGHSSQHSGGHQADCDDGFVNLAGGDPGPSGDFTSCAAKAAKEPPKKARSAHTTATGRRDFI